MRIAQYEKEARVPKDDLVNHMASLLDVSPMAIKVPDIETEYNLRPLRTRRFVTMSVY